jgi:hypothetical protein
LAALVVSILLHAGLGLALSALVWVVGLGWLAILPGRDAAEPVDAYPVGLLAVVLASILVLVSWWLAPVAALLLLPALRAPVRVLAPAARPLRWALAPALALPVALGLLLHGPSDELDSHAYGDMLYYVNKIVSAAIDVTAFRDLLAEGQRIIYAEAAPSFAGAVLSHLPGFDPVLAQTTTMPAFLLASVCAGLGLVGARTTPVTALALGLVATALTAYPTWITESPPIAMSIPLAFSLHRLARRGAPTSWLLGMTAVIALDLFLTKVLALLPAGIVLAFALWERRRALDRRVAVAVLAITGAVVALLFATAAWYLRLAVWDFAPADAVRGLRRQLDTRDTQAAAPAFAMAGQLVLLAALVRVRSWPIVAALGASLLGSWLVGGQLAGLDIAIATAIVLAALELWTRPEALARVRGLVLAAGVLLALSSWFRDISAIRAGFVFVVLLAATLVVALGAAGGLPARQLAFVLAAAGTAALVGLAGRSFVAFLVAAALAAVALLLPRLARPALAVTAVAALVLAAAGDLRLAGPPGTLTTDDYAVWQRVADVVPDDGLVFTNLTGEVVDGRQGWNNYPSIAGRQLYLAGWYDGRLVSRPEELARRLALNRDVLEGRLPPGRLDLDRPYGSYWAVVWSLTNAPPAFRRVYGNETFALYRIPA